MAIFYSASTNSFFDEAIHGPRSIEQVQSTAERKAGKRPALVPNPDCLIPEDAVEISAAEHQKLLAAQGQNWVIAASGGRPVMVERDTDPEERRALRRRERDRRLAASDWTQLPDAPLAATPRDEWSAYRQALRDLDMDSSDWPLPPATVAV
ncbi:MAG: hypothetical protein IE933_03630 [Sphingomonadales bacterium]|nr:hypothetical protein [Sphingomonadales bacterium]MBD3772135.1 hypothetical protein [Paracoccaceae bacterium]